MRRGIRLLPYRTADDSAVNWESWWFERGETRLPLPKYLPGWDYASELTVGLTATIDPGLVLASTGLASLDQLAIVLVGDCKASQRRFTSTVSLFPECEIVEVGLELPPGQVADSMDLCAVLVLAADIEPAADRVQWAGSRLASSHKQSFILEGDASRFPTEPISFSAAGYEAAPWTISSTAESLEDSLMGTIRLLINEDHPWGQQLLADAGSSVSQHLHVDVFRSLVSICADLGEPSAGEFEDDSLGGVVDYMCQLYLRRGISEAVKVIREEPLRFDRLVYAAVTP